MTRCAATNSSTAARWRTSVSKDSCRCHPMAAANTIKARIAPSGISRASAGVRSEARCAGLISIDMMGYLYLDRRRAIALSINRRHRVIHQHYGRERTSLRFHVFLLLARRNVIDVRRAPAKVNGVLPPCIDEIEAVPYKPAQLSDI